MPKKTNPVTQKSGASINIVLTAIVLIVAVVVIGGVLLLNRGGNSQNQATPGETVPASVLQPQNSNMISKGPEGAPTLVEFVDYQCSSCHTYYKQVTSKIEKQYEGKINFVVRNFPLEMHPLAPTAAKAVEAAAMQGKFEEMYHQVFDNYQSWATASSGKPSDDKQRAIKQFETYAQQIGLDRDKFRADMNSPQVEKQIQQDKADGSEAGVQGTPTFFLDGKKINFSRGENPLQGMRDKLDGALAK
ncbi:protein-disulfide isomerase [Saccharopolyspora lacisalsi]|uniref:Protein-disulfide isomerase n=1 Tax=Halosaccharopolyspora lacisalsi TaxID=1000566 RepID=A0A839E4M4_9PSEU|nr:thioredoxin domain-containing protein [Halosaccharopolyspora lacisalsi]MBA8825868.1 protein-disulfide isomerase [Halosaccharopolyspora lacisalsi]